MTELWCVVGGNGDKRHGFVFCKPNLKAASQAEDFRDQIVDDRWSEAMQALGEGRRPLAHPVGDGSHEYILLASLHGCDYRGVITQPAGTLLPLGDIKKVCASERASVRARVCKHECESE